MIEHIPALKIEANDDDTFTLEQDCSGNTSCVTVHKLHVRHLAETIGLLPSSGNRNLPSAAMLARRLKVLFERIKEVDDRLWSVPAHPPGSNMDDPDLWYSDATLSIAREFCADLDDAEPASHVPAGHLPVTRDAAVTTASGAQANPAGAGAGAGALQLTLEG